MGNQKVDRVGEKKSFRKAKKWGNGKGNGSERETVGRIRRKRILSKKALGGVLFS